MTDRELADHYLEERRTLAKMLTNATFERHRYKKLLEEILEAPVGDILTTDWLQFRERIEMAFKEGPVYEV